MRGRPPVFYRRAPCSYFNPRPHAGATAMWRVFAIFAIFQSTPPCGGDGEEALDTWLGITISIHAPMRGRPVLFDGCNVFCRFQSTPPCGGDAVFLALPDLRQQFQSTPPCGGDFVRSRNVKSTVISIHAPSRGRRPASRSSLSVSNFNPRPLTGATLLWGWSPPGKTFQSTPPHGGDGHARCAKNRAWAISIHAPSRGRPASR